MGKLEHVAAEKKRTAYCATSESKKKELQTVQGSREGRLRLKSLRGGEEGTALVTRGETGYKKGEEDQQQEMGPGSNQIREHSAEKWHPTTGNAIQRREGNRMEKPFP